MKPLLILPLVVLISCNQNEPNKKNSDTSSDTTIKKNDFTKNRGIDRITEEMINKIPNSDLPPNTYVTIYEHINFGGASMNLDGEMCYREENITLPKNSISSLKVPFGMNATLYGNWECRNKLLDYPPADYKFVGPTLNDLTRSVKVLRKSIFYAGNGNAVNGGDYQIKEKFKIAPGYTVKWTELTKAGEASWDAGIRNDSFYINIQVNNTSSWCGVGAWYEKKK